MQEEFGKQISSVFAQWDGDIQKSKDAEEKLEVKRSHRLYLFEVLSACNVEAPRNPTKSSLILGI